MKDPNNNPIVHKVARDLVKANGVALKARAKFGAASLRYYATRAEKREAYVEADRIVEEAHRVADEVREGAHEALKQATDNLNAARDAQDVAIEGAESAKAALVLACTFRPTKTSSFKSLEWRRLRREHCDARESLEYL